MRAIVADDHPLYREAVRLRLERMFPAAAIEEASGVDELLRFGSSPLAKVDLILLDLNMPGMTGADAIGRVVAAFSPTPVVLMSGLASAADVIAGVRAGARGFLPKTMASDQFAAALSIIVDGGTYVPADILEIPLPDTPAPPARPFEHLTPREQQVLVRLATGASNKEIGRDLGLAEVTIKLHVRQILKKISARNRSEAASMATRAGLI